MKFCEKKCSVRKRWRKLPDLTVVSLQIFSSWQHGFLCKVYLDFSQRSTDIPYKERTTYLLYTLIGCILYLMLTNLLKEKRLKTYDLWTLEVKNKTQKTCNIAAACLQRRVTYQFCCQKRPPKCLSITCQILARFNVDCKNKYIKRYVNVGREPINKSLEQTGD